MQSLRHPVITATLLGWHLLLAALGHGLHYFTVGARRDVAVVAACCGCGSDSTAGGRRGLTLTACGLDNLPEEPHAIVDSPVLPLHDARRCAICQWMAQHKELPAASAADFQVEAVAESPPPASFTTHGLCACPYASRAPPGGTGPHLTFV